MGKARLWRRKISVHRHEVYSWDDRLWPILVLYQQSPVSFVIGRKHFRDLGTDEHRSNTQNNEEVRKAQEDSGEFNSSMTMNFFLDSPRLLRSATTPEIASVLHTVEETQGCMRFLCTTNFNPRSPGEQTYPVSPPDPPANLCHLHSCQPF